MARQMNQQSANQGGIVRSTVRHAESGPCFRIVWKERHAPKRTHRDLMAEFRRPYVPSAN
jgi:hypothetical protein